MIARLPFLKKIYLVENLIAQLKYNFFYLANKILIVIKLNPEAAGISQNCI